MLGACPIGAGSILLVVPGAPRTKKTHNRLFNRHSKRPLVMPSEYWVRWRDAAQRALGGVLAEAWLAGVIPLHRPVNAQALFFRDRRVGDSHGFYQGLADVLEHLGVVHNDRLIETWDGSRLLIDRVNPRTEVTLS